jgi:hypothetical protein
MAWPFKSAATNRQALANFVRMKAGETQGDSMPKKTKPSAPTADLLPLAKAAHEAATLSIAEIVARRDAALLDGADHSAIADLDRELADQRRALAIETDRIALLEQRAAEEAWQRRAEAHVAQIESVEAIFAERNAAGAELAEHLAAAVIAYRKVVSLNETAGASWPFSFAETGAALLGHGFVSAVGAELYRLSGSEAAVPGEHQAAFPGARCPSITDPRPGSVPPLVEQMREATAYASRVMRDLPAPTPPAPPPKPIVVPAAAAPVAEKLPDRPEAPSVSTTPAQPEYVYLVDLVNPTTRVERTEEVKFGAADIEEASLDRLGPTGNAGRAIALRLAIERAPEDFIYAGKMRFDMGRLTKSLDRD